MLNRSIGAAAMMVATCQALGLLTTQTGPNGLAWGWDNDGNPHEQSGAKLDIFWARSKFERLATLPDGTPDVVKQASIDPVIGFEQALAATVYRIQEIEVVFDVLKAYPAHCTCCLGDRDGTLVETTLDPVGKPDDVVGGKQEYSFEDKDERINKVLRSIAFCRNTAGLLTHVRFGYADGSVLKRGEQSDDDTCQTLEIEEWEHVDDITFHTDADGNITGVDFGVSDGAKKDTASFGTGGTTSTKQEIKGEIIGFYSSKSSYTETTYLQLIDGERLAASPCPDSCF